MQHPALAGFSVALVAAHAALATYCVAAYLRRRAELALFLLGLLNGALVLLDGGYALAFYDASGLVRGVFLGEAGRLAASVLLVHLCLVHIELPRPRRALTGLYAGGAALLVAGATGLSFGFDLAWVRDVGVLGVALPDVHLALGRFGGLVVASTLAAGLMAPLALGRSVLRGRPDGLALAGATALAVAAVIDALHAIGAVPGPPLAPLGFAAFTTAFTMTTMFKSASTRRELEARARDLKQRSRALASAYAELRAEKEELVRKEQLAAVGELSAVIAHEVRNPLAIISNAVATLRRGQIEAADRDTLLGILDEETSRLNRLVGDLLRYARPVDLQRQLVAVREILDRTLAAANARVDLAVEVVERGEPPRVWADAALLRQAVENLVTNAMQAMQAGGSLTVTLAPDEVEGAGGVELAIQDTGEGMDTLVRKRALDPFFTTRPSGTGLGLAIVARIVDAHGGRLRIQSASGAGTLVSVFLPVGTEVDTSASAAAERSSEPPVLSELKRAMGQR